MNSFGEAALYLAKQWQFHIIAVAPGKKDPPLYDHPYDVATHDEAEIKELWRKYPYANPAISTHRWNGGKESLIVLDIDVKPEKGVDGFNSLAELKKQGLSLPATYMQGTPHAGVHVVYRHPEAVAGGVSVLGPGLDIRSHHNYILGVGAVVGGKGYRLLNDEKIAECPTWLVDMCNRPRGRDVTPPPENLDPHAAEGRAIAYLLTAPIAVSGEGGNSLTYQVACHVRDEGVDEFTCLCVMMDHWNDRCLPPWSDSELSKIVHSAYSYARDPIGNRAPEADFKPLPVEKLPEIFASGINPINRYNETCAVLAGGSKVSVIVEHTDQEGRIKFDNYSERDFKLYKKNDLLPDGKEISAAWLKSPQRRTVYGFEFNPRKLPSRDDKYINLWRGFDIQPLAAGEEPSAASKEILDMYLGHIHDNVLQDCPEHYDWFIGYLAHLYQRPWERPDAGLVLRGKEGTGKNFVFNQIRDLIGRKYYFETPRQSDLKKRFNVHLETVLLMVMGEAFWAGDSEMSSLLKDMVTNDYQQIERKFGDTYSVRRYTRLVMLSNEDWVIKSSREARRWFVTDVGDARRQDNAYFGHMRRGLEAHAFPLLARFLAQYDINRFDFNTAPKTRALMEQQFESATPFEKFWFDCLYQGTIVDGNDDRGWPETVKMEVFRDCYVDASREKGYKGVLGTEARVIGKWLRELCPSVTNDRKSEGGVRKWVYKLPPLEIARQEFQRGYAHPIKWEEDED